MKALCLISIALAAPLAAQSVTFVAPDKMRFTDSPQQVTFLYPATWTFSLQQPFYFPLSTTGISDSNPQGNLRGFVFANSLPGVKSWPTTSFAGVEFGYDLREMATANDCRAFAVTTGSPANPQPRSEPVALHDLLFWHATAFDGGMSHEISEDIYTTYTGSGSTGVCFRFDLAVQSVSASGDAPMRKLTNRENAVIQGALAAILDSVRVPSSPR